MPYTGPLYRGVDYSPTWVSWNQGLSAQTGDSDFFNDAFASFWAGAYQAAPPGDLSAPFNNTGKASYRNDLQTMATDGFNLVRLYNWDMARGTTSTSNTGLDHLNFLNTVKQLGLQVVVPVSDFFLSQGSGNPSDGWNNTAPDSNYSFTSAPAAIQQDFKQFIASITDSTGKIHAAIQSIDVGNEGDQGQGISDGTTAAQFLARTNWWIYNLHQQINGTPAMWPTNGPDGLPVVNGAASTTNPAVMITATFSNSAQVSWWNDLINGVTATDIIPAGYSAWAGNQFGTAVKGLSVQDSTWASYYYNSVNVSQSSASAPYTSTVTSVVVSPYDNATPQYTVPLLLMEVFTNNRQTNPPTTPPFTYDQSQAAVNQAADIEAYLRDQLGGSNLSKTWLMGYNYFEFNDEPSQPKYNGLYQYPAGTGAGSVNGYQDSASNAQTGTTSTFYGGFGTYSFPVNALTATPGPFSGTYSTLVEGWTEQFHPLSGTVGNDNLVGTALVDMIRGGPGNDKINGGLGYDTALYGQNAKNYTLAVPVGGSAVFIQDKVGTDGTDSLSSVEGVRFADQVLPTSWVIATASMPAAQILKVVDLYTAGLGRAPDALGLDFWASQLAAGAKLSDIAKGLFGSSEAAAIYSSSNPDPAFVNLVYQTAFGRAADTSGLAYWTNELDTGHIARTDLVTALIAGATGTDKQYVANREAVGAHFALTQGLNNLTWARAVESGVTAAASTVTAANAQTDAFAATAAAPATSELVVQILGIVP